MDTIEEEIQQLITIWREREPESIEGLTDQELETLARKQIEWFHKMGGE